MITRESSIWQLKSARVQRTNVNALSGPRPDLLTWWTDKNDACLLYHLTALRYEHLIFRDRLVWLSSTSYVKVTTLCAAQQKAIAFILIYCCDLFRHSHSSHSSVHWAERPPGPGIDRDPFRLLHGGKRGRLPALRLVTHDRKTLADHLLSCFVLPHLCYVRTGVASVPPGKAQDPHPLRMRDRGGMHAATVSLHRAPGKEARVLGGSLDASHPLRIHLPQHLPSRVHFRPILRQVRDFFCPCGGRVCPVQCAC